MSTDAVTKRLTEVSPRLKARVAGVAYLMNFAFAPGFIAIGKFVIPGDAAATATNLLAHEALFRLGFAGNLIAIAGYITVTALFYELFKPVSRTVSFLAALFSLVGCVVLAVSCLFYVAPFVAPFVALDGAHYLDVFAPPQLQALALMFLKLYGQSFNLSFVFFGFYQLLIGYLIFRSNFMPRILGVGFALGGLVGLTFLSPPLAHYLFRYILILDIGEGALVLWLLIVGVNSDRWKEQARAAGELR
jgi:hypothetical protein